MLAKVVVEVYTWPCDVHVVLSKQISTSKLSTPFHVNGVEKVCVYQPVVVIFIVVGPKTVIWLVGDENVVVNAVALTPASLTVYVFMG